MTISDISVINEFVQRVQENGTLWGLHSEGGWVVCESALYEDTDVIPFWTSEQAANKQCSAEWENYTPVAISLEEFQEIWLVELANDAVMIGIDWDSNLVGEELDPLEIEKAFIQLQTMQQ